MKTLVATLFFFLLTNPLQGQSLTPTLETIIIDANGKVMGALSFDNGLRFLLHDGRQVLLKFQWDRFFSSSIRYFTNGDCVGTGYIDDIPIDSGFHYGPDYSFVIAWVDEEQNLYLNGEGVFAHQYRDIQSRRMFNGAPCETMSARMYVSPPPDPSTAYLNLAAIFTPPFRSGSMPAAKVDEAFFADVPPTHPLFEFVQLLRLSGLTAGCGDNKFCPDSPVTRGQIAVFLSKLMGLHVLR